MVASGGCQFKTVPKDKLPSLLNQIESYCENERFSRLQFEKYLASAKKIDQNSIYYGLFQGDKCLALAYLNKTPGKFVLLAQISCVMHGYGAVLIQNIISKSACFWLVANPDGGNKLVDYYRRFDLKEHVIRHSKWADREEQHAFYKANVKEDEAVLMNMLENAEQQ